MVEIKWTPNAVEELDDIANYNSKDSPNYAQILVKQIYEIPSKRVSCYMTLFLWNSYFVNIFTLKYYFHYKRK